MNSAKYFHGRWMKPFALNMQSISNLARYSNFLYSPALFIPYFHIHLRFLHTYSLMLPINSLIFSCSWYIVSLSNQYNCWQADCKMGRISKGQFQEKTEKATCWRGGQALVAADLRISFVEICCKLTVMEVAADHICNICYNSTICDSGHHWPKKAGVEDKNTA